MAQRFIRDPDSVLDYAINWEEWLDGDTIATSAWTANDGDITVDTHTNTSTTTTVWVSGGTVGQFYRLTNTIVTNAGRTDERSLSVQVQQR